jgi:hypothetical protein
MRPALSRYLTLGLVFAIACAWTEPARALDSAIYKQCTAGNCDGPHNNCLDGCTDTHCSFFRFATLRCDISAWDSCNDTCYAIYNFCLKTCSSLAGNINPFARLVQQGRHVQVSGPMECDDNLVLDTHVTITQKASGALATGHTRTPCTADSFQVRAQSHGAERFQVGRSVDVCAVGQFRDGETIVDTRQWCNEVLLSAFDVIPAE